jgi:quinol monooxygenase YgiN
VATTHPIEGKTMAIVVTAVFHPADGHTTELINALRRNIPAVHNEQGCRLLAGTTEQGEL